jgi:hypothetical protein
LRRAAIRPQSVAALLGNQRAGLEFRNIVRQVFPDAEAEIWHTCGATGTQENRRVSAFVQRVEAQFFPVYECEEYDQIAWGIPFIRLGWSYEGFHDLERRLGELLLLSLCEAPVDVRISLLDALETHVPRTLLERIPPNGFSPTELLTRFEATSCVALAEYALWLWGSTGTVFLDLSDEVDVTEADWTQENIEDLAAQWQRTRGILNRIDALAAWLEADPTAHLAQLLDAALGCDARLVYQRTRRLYVAEITETGIVAIARDEPDTVALSVGSSP